MSEWVKVKVTRKDITAIVEQHADKAGSHNATAVLHHLANEARRKQEVSDATAEE